jgi:hypothetical protein
VSDGPERDFFISYTGMDKDWAVWIAVELERAGYSTFSQALDIRPGSDFVREMQRAATSARHTIAVLSPAYFESTFGESEWRVAFSNDPTGERGLLIPVRVRPVTPLGLLRTRVFIDLVDLDESTASRRLLEGVDAAPPRPTSAPFPGSPTTASSSAEKNPQFPGVSQPDRRAEPCDWQEVTAAVTDAAGIVQGSAFFIGNDVAVTSTHALRSARADATLRLTGRPEPIEVLEVDRDDGLGVALVKLGPAPGLSTIQFSYEDVNIVGRSVAVPGFTADGPTVHSDVVARTITRRWNDQWNDQKASFFQLDTLPANSMSGAPLIDTDTRSVIGVLRLSEREEAPLAVPFSEISRRWPVLAQQHADYPATYNAIVTTHLPDVLVRSKWDRFVPERLHCVVVTSESALDEGDMDGLDTLFRDVLAGPAAPAVWELFLRAVGTHTLLGGSDVRALPDSYTRSSVALAKVGVLDAFDSAKSLELASRLIIEADLALFDVTGFEPGGMLLLGIRAATRRGVTIVSHGGGWRTGEPLNRPFNLSDLSLASHTPSSDRTGDDPRITRMAQRIRAGFDKLVMRPLYKDLPVYDAIRELGPSRDARRTIALEEEILMLCSYDDSFFANWKRIRSLLQQALAEADIIGNVVRLQDIQDPQLVSLSLYDRIRRCAGCVADWTNFSASTFFELGVRIAVSQWGVIQLVSNSWIAQVADGRPARSKRQFDLMLRLFNPIQYDDDKDETVGGAIAARLIDLRNTPELQGGHGLRNVAAEALARVDTRVPDIVAQLSQEADALHHPDQLRQNVPRALYYEIPAIKKDQERAALERRIAAWFYLDKRLGAGTRAADDPLHRAWVDTGRTVAAELFASPDQADQALALEISEKVE